MTHAMADTDEEFIAFGPWWVEARAYSSMQLAGEAFLRLSTLLRDAEPLNVSAYRLTLNGSPLVAMVGEAPIQRAWRRRFHRAYGTTTTEFVVPEEVAIRLLRRSLAAWQANEGFIERRDINEVVE